MKYTMFKYKQLILRILTLLCVVIVISSCIYSVRVYSSSIGLFDGVDIQIIGNNYIDSQRIKNEIYPQISSSLLSINLTDIRTKLESIDYIEAVQVGSILPHTLMIYIVERLPVLLINKDDLIIFMDKKGVLLPANNLSIGIFPVPVLSILNENISKEKYIADIAKCFQFIIDEYPLFYNNLSEIKIQEGVWEFYSDNNTKIFASDKYLANQLNILKDFEKTVYPMRNLYDYSYIDLRIKGQVIVKEKYRKG